MKLWTKPMNGAIPLFPLGTSGERAGEKGSKRPPLPDPLLLVGGCVFSAMVGMARCAVPARAVAGGTNIRATLAFEGVAPLHASRTSQRDVPATQNTYCGRRGRNSSHTVTPIPQNLIVPWCAQERERAGAGTARPRKTPCY